MHILLLTIYYYIYFSRSIHTRLDCTTALDFIITTILREISYYYVIMCAAYTVKPYTIGERAALSNAHRGRYTRVYNMCDVDYNNVYSNNNMVYGNNNDNNYMIARMFSREILKRPISTV